MWVDINVKIIIMLNNIILYWYVFCMFMLYLYKHINMNVSNIIIQYYENKTKIRT
jgi:hypothetical protein